MGLSYKETLPAVLVGSKSAALTRTSVTLTTAYDDASTTKVFNTGGYTKANFDILYTMGSGETSNSIEMRLRGSADGTNFYRIPNEAVSGGTSTLTAREFTFVGANAAAATISVGIDIFYKYMDVSFKESGVASTAGTVFCEVSLAGQ